MQVPRRADFAEQRERFAFRCCCEDCCYFNASEEVCAHFWPTELHRRERYGATASGPLVFCKEFELR